MKNILKDAAKIRSFVQIQENLNELPENATETEINSLIENIPKQMLTQKDDLMIICKLFAYYARNFQQTSKKNAINLFEKILDIIKQHLQNESEFFFNIFGGTHYLHLYMYQQGLISIDEIIQRAIRFKFPPFINYFLPEIIEKEPKLFENEIKNNLTFEYTDIDKFKELRTKHFKWMRESNDYNDPIYREIETNSLRFAIKIDDIESFQKIYSNLNLKVNSTIRESLLENVFVHYPEDSTLLEFAIQFNSMKIVKYLIMNGCDAKNAIYHSIWRRNYEIIHMVESLEKEEFEKYSLYYSITVCNNEMAEYSLNNYDSCYPLGKSEFDSSDVEDLLSIIGNTFRSSNFVFLEQTLLPFLRKNEKFVEENIYKILAKTVDDHTGYFLKEFLNHPKIDINNDCLSFDKMSILESALHKRNTRCVEVILNNPNINVNSEGFRCLNPVTFACFFICDVKTIDMILNHKNSNLSDIDILVSACAIIGNFPTIKYLLDRFGDKDLNVSYHLMFLVIDKKHICTFRLLLKYFITKNDQKTANELINDFTEYAKTKESFNENIISKFVETVHEFK